MCCFCFKGKWPHPCWLTSNRPNLPTKTPGQDVQREVPGPAAFQRPGDFGGSQAGASDLCEGPSGRPKAPVWKKHQEPCFLKSNVAEHKGSSGWTLGHPSGRYPLLQIPTFSGVCFFGGNLVFQGKYFLC